MLLLAYVDLDVFRAGTLTDDHSGINLFARSDKESTTILSGEQTVSYGFTGLECDQGTGRTIFDITAVSVIAVENGVDDTISFGIG